MYQGLERTSETLLLQWHLRPLMACAVRPRSCEGEGLSDKFVSELKKVPVIVKLIALQRMQIPPLKLRSKTKRAFGAENARVELVILQLKKLGPIKP